MQILFRAIITGFGLRLGAEIAKQVTKRIFPEDESKKTAEQKAEEAAEDDELPGTSPEPPTFEESRADLDPEDDLEADLGPEMQAS